MDKQWQQSKGYIKKAFLLVGVCGGMLLTACEGQEKDGNRIQEAHIPKEEGGKEEQETGDVGIIQDFSHNNDKDLEKEKAKKEELMKKNEDRFFRMAGDAGLNETEATDYYKKLCEDNVFQDGIMDSKRYGGHGTKSRG